MAKVDPLPTKSARIRLEAELQKSSYARMHYEIWVICFGMGLRIGDALAMRWDQIDAFGRYTFSPQKQKRLDKNGNPRRLKIISKQLNDRAQETMRLRRLKSRPHAVHVFESPYGRSKGRAAPYTDRAVAKIWKEAGKKAGLTGVKIGTHTGRKTLGRETYYGSGRDISLVCELLYQADPRATLHYIGVKTDETDRAMALWGQ